MENRRVRIADIAQELGVSTATVSNVIHGKTEKVSEETIKRVQQLLEKRQYIPSMAGVLLAQNDSKILGVVVNDHEKYEGHTLEDQFICAAVNALAAQIERAGKFLMLKVTDRWDQIPKFASMWNMEGMVLIGFCEQDYQKLRENMRIPFVIYDGYVDGAGNFANITADHFGGGVQVGRYLKRMGHRKVLCISDNDIYVDMERLKGLKSEIPETELMVIPMERRARAAFYGAHLPELLQYTAVFAVSDYYAMDLIRYLQGAGIGVPEEISVVGFDDVRACESFFPPLTTVRQDCGHRAALALEMLQMLKDGLPVQNVRLPVTLVERKSVKTVNLHKNETLDLL